GWLCSEELGKFTLRQDNTFCEVVERKADYVLLNLCGEILLISRQHPAFHFEPGLLGGRACSSATDNADGRVHLPIHREIESNLRLHLALADDRCNEPTIIIARHTPVQRKDHGIDQARLTRPGRPRQDEKLRILERDLCRLSEGSEPF